MILENKWYEANTVQDSGFFTDLQSRSREKIVWFPKIYYQMEKGLLHIIKQGIFDIAVMQGLVGQLAI